MKILDILTSPWAIMPDKLAEIQDIYARHLKGEKIDIAGIEARLGRPLQSREQGYEVVNNVAIIPVDGVVAKRMNLFSQISGGASSELVARDLFAALNDPEVKSIILDIDSPGGTVDGTAELAQIIYESRDEKPIVAWANGLMASAAYWFGSAAHQVYNSGATTKVGSIGILAKHVDASEQDRKIGIKRTNIYAGKYKVVGADNVPLSKEDAAIIQAEVDYLYSIFVQTVATHRGVDVQTVLDKMADGRVFTGQQAIDAGLVDGVATMDQLIEAMSGGVLPNPSEFSAGALSGVDTDDSTDSKKETEMTVITKTKPKAEGGTAPAAADGDACTLGDGSEGVMQGGECVPKDSGTSQPAAADGDACTLPDGSPGVMQNGECVADEPETEAEAVKAVHPKVASIIRAAGAKAERARIQSVLAQSVSGHEALINKLAFDGKTTGPEAAVQVLNAIKGKQTSMADAMHQDGKDLTAIAPSAGGNVVQSGGDQVDENAPIEERVKAEWDKNAALRAEFGSFEEYAAYAKAEASGRVKSIGQRRQQA